MSDSILGNAVGGEVAEPVVQDAPVDSGSLADNVSVGNNELDWGWLGDVDSETLGYVQNKGFKSPADILKSYQHLEKFRGADETQLLKLPSNDEERNEFQQRLGRPETVDGYKFEAPEGYQENETDQILKQKFFEHGVSSEAFSDIAKVFIEAQSQTHQKQEAQAIEDHNNQVQELRDKLGTRFDSVISSAERAARSIGMDDEAIGKFQEVFGPQKAVELLINLSKNVGEDNIDSINNELPLGSTQEQVEARISQLISAVNADPKRYQMFQSKAGDDYVEWQKLNNTRAQLYKE